MNVLTTEHKNLSSNPTKNDRAVTTGISGFLLVNLGKFGVGMLIKWCILTLRNLKSRGGVLEDVLGLEDVLEDTFSSPWPRSLKSLALASKP